MLLLTHLYYWPGRPCMHLPPIPRPLIVSPLQSPVAVHRGSPRVPVVIYVDQPLTAAMVISPPSGHVGSVVPPERYPIVAAAVAADVAAALPDSYESHFPLARVTRERKCAHSCLPASSSSAAVATDNPSTGPCSPLASCPSPAAGAGLDTMASCDSHGAATMYDLSLIACLVATFFCMFLFQCLIYC